MPAHHLNGFICIALDETQDLYNINFYSNKKVSEMLEHPVSAYEAIERDEFNGWDKLSLDETIA